MPHPPLVIDADRIERETFVRATEVHVELPSTNDRALELAGVTTTTPHLIVALRQTAGRGRGANRWWADDGALTFSLIVEPDTEALPFSRWPELSLAAGGAVCEALQSLLPSADVRLKWPNDVYLAGRKVCGVLVEIPPDRRTPANRRIVFGVGINVNNSLSAAPPEVRSRATSLADVAGRTFDLTDVLASVLRWIETDLSAIAAHDSRIFARWRRRCLLSGRSVVLSDGTRSIGGTCLGIDDDGALLLQTEAGPQRFFGGVVEAFE